jgi:hypothetical protein
MFIDSCRDEITQYSLCNTYCAINIACVGAPLQFARKADRAFVSQLHSYHCRCGKKRVQMWFMHDSAPLHFTIAVQEHLHNTYSEWWVGRGRMIVWSPHLPSSIKLDFFLWGHLKSVVYVIVVSDVADLQQWVEDECWVIQNTPGMSEQVRQSLLWHA